MVAMAVTDSGAGPFGSGRAGLTKETDQGAKDGPAVALAHFVFPAVVAVTCASISFMNVSSLLREHDILLLRVLTVTFCSSFFISCSRTRTEQPQLVRQ